MPGEYRWYSPSEPAAITFAVLYGLICAATTIQYFYYRCWFWFFAVLATWMETVGYICKCLSVNNQDSQALFAVQYVLILVAPAVMAASCYMCMGRIALYVTPPKHRNVRTLWVTPKWMTPVFVACDVTAFLIQVIGGIMAVSTNTSTVQTGFTVLQIGLGVQIAAFGFFLIISFRFHLVSRNFSSEWPDNRWTAMLWAINGASSLIFLRSVYRMVEFSTGFTGYLNTHEWNFYVFDGALILIAMAAFNLWHPAQYLSNIGWKQTDGPRRSRDDIEIEEVALA